MFRQTSAETLGIKAYYIFNKQNTIKAYLGARYIESTQAICYNHSNSNGVMDMELRVLKYFLMVAREENITKAAQLLHVTQLSVRRQRPGISFCSRSKAFRLRRPVVWSFSAT